MSERIAAVLDEIEAQQQKLALPQGITALPLLQMAYRGQVQLTPQQMRAAIEALPFEVPKRSAVAITTIDGLTYAQALEREERAMERSKQALLLNGPKTVEHEPLVTSSDLKKPMSRYRRF